MEVAQTLTTFVESLESRKDNDFLSTVVQNEIDKAVDEENITKELVLMTTRPFYGFYNPSIFQWQLFILFLFLAECIDYIQKWTVHFEHLKIFAWSALERIPDWESIQTSAKFIASKHRFNIESNDTELFDQTTFLKRYVIAEKIQSWKENKTATDQRWVEIFQYFAKNHIPHQHILTIVSYILCLPGTSATVERIFSLIKDIWSDDKSQLQIETLKCILYVRYNIKMTCLEFYNFLKNQPQMLQAIGSNAKYTFKKCK